MKYGDLIQFEPIESVVHMTYAVPDHPEYRRYLVRDFLVASTLGTTNEHE